jgi:CRISPR-associated protein Cas1
MAQGLLLRNHGYRSDHGYVYYAGSRQRVRVEFSPELESETRETISAARVGRGSTTMPLPLEDSPKCWGCSLCGICLPDETNALRTVEIPESLDTDNFPGRVAGGFDEAVPSLEESMTEGFGSDVRRLFPARDRAMPFYVQEQGARVGKSGERLTVTKEKETVGGARLLDVSQLVLMGNVQVSSQALHLMMEKGIPVVHFSTGGWFHGISHGIGIENAYARAAQYEVAADPARCVQFARALTRAKAGNQRALLGRCLEASR